MEKKFSKIQIAAIKRTAQNVATFVTKKERIDAKIAELEAEKKALQPLIDSFQGPIKEMTGGYTTEDLVQREVVKTGKIDTKTGKEIISTRYILKYPDTVIPVACEAETFEAPMTEKGNDFDMDAEAPQEVEEVAVESESEDDPWA